MSEYICFRTCAALAALSALIAFLGVPVSVQGMTSAPPALMGAQMEVRPDTVSTTLGLTETTGTATGVIEGQIVNGTVGGAVPAETPVELQIFKGMNREENRALLSDVSGHFQFINLETSQEYSYQVLVRYKAATYFSDILTLYGNPKPAPLTITVYEVTTQDSNIHVERAHIIVNVNPRSLQIGQMYVFSNNSDRVYIGSEEREGVPTLQFPLPAGATNLRFQQGALGDRYITTTNGFADTWPVLPGVGTQQILYSYDVPFNASKLTLTLTNPYSVTVLNVLISDPQVRLNTLQLKSEGIRDMQNTRWLSFSGQDLPKGQVLALEFDNLPLEARAVEATGSALPGRAGMGQIVAIGVVAFLLGTVVGHFVPPMLKRESRSAAAHGRTRTIEGLSEDEIIVALADLDDAYEGGHIPEDDYQRRRAKLKAMLIRKATQEKD